MDATPKGPSVSPTSDILSSLPSCRISDLNVRAPYSALYRPQRSRRISRHPSLDARRTTKTTTYVSSLSYTCLNFSRLFCCKLKQLPILYLHVLDNNNQPVHSQKLNIRTKNRRIATSKNQSRYWFPKTNASSPKTALRTRNNIESFSTILNLWNRDRKSFFTLVFTPRRSCRKFDAFFTTQIAKRFQVEKVLLTGVTFYVKHIYRLRPKTPNSELQPNRSHKQCRAALSRVLCKVSNY